MTYDCGIILVIFCLIKGNDCFVAVLCLLLQCVEGFMLFSGFVIFFASSLENYLNEKENADCCVIAFVYSKICDKRPLTNRQNNALNDKW